MATKVLLQPSGQSGSSIESRAIMHLSMLENSPIEEILTVAYDNLNKYSELLISDAVIPVGSVEFVRKAMTIAGTIEPDNMSYPGEAKLFLERHVDLMTIGQFLESSIGAPKFIKPKQTKQFTGFIFEPCRPSDYYNEHDQEQLKAFQGLPASSEIWVCDKVEFQCEWRYYVQSGKIIGQARYDPDGLDEAPEPDINVVHSCIKQMQSSNCNLTCALDFGVLNDGRTALVECNDAWAIGLYGKTLSPAVYFDFLCARWHQIRSTRRLKFEFR